MMVKGMVFEDTIEYAIICAYCAGKGYWWNVFFGWRKTTKQGHVYYILPRKAWKELAVIEQLIKT